MHPDKVAELIRAGLPGAQVLLQTFDLDAWIEAKLQGISFGEAVRRKFEAAERRRLT